MFNYLRNTACLVVAGTVAGCGGGGSVSFSPGTNGLPYGATGLTATQARFESLAGNKISGTASRATYTPGGGSFTAGKAAVAAELTYNSNNTITLKLGSNTYTLSEVGGGFSDGTVTLVPGFSGGTALTNSVLFFGASKSSGSAADPAFESHFVTGFQTPPDEMAALATTETYAGEASMTTRSFSGASLSGQTAVLDEVDLNLTVDFSAANNQVSGTISGPVDAAVGGGTISIPVTATISGANFSGTLGDATATGWTGLTISDGGMSGGFFGPDARDVGGNFQADLSGGSLPGATSGAGFFVGTQN